MGLGIGEIMLILMVITLFVGRRRLLDLPRAVMESVRELKRRPQGQRFIGQNLPALITSLLGGISFITISILSLADVISAVQTLVVTSVVFVWLIVGYYCFGKRD